MGGAGGAGGFRLSNSVGCLAAPVMSPLANPTGVTVAVQSYPIVVGAGGARAPGISQKGANGDASSVFFNYFSRRRRWCGPVRNS